MHAQRNIYYIYINTNMFFRKYKTSESIQKGGCANVCCILYMSALLPYSFCMLETRSTSALWNCALSGLYGSWPPTSRHYSC